jgi:hypothetical protein
MSRRAAVTAVALVLGAALPALAAASTNLGPVGFGTVAVDSARSHVLVSAPAADAIDELDYTGALVGQLSGLPGAWGLVVGDSNSVFVAESTAGAIVRVDFTDGGTKTSLVAMGLYQPRWLVFAGGKLWTTVGPAGSWDQLASVNPQSGVVKVWPGSYYNPDLAVSPGLPNALFVAADGQSPGQVWRLSVGGPTPVVTATVRTNGSNIRDFAVSAEGTRVVLAQGYPYHFDELSASTLLPDGIAYPGNPYPSAVAMSGGATNLLATGLANGYSSPDLAVFPLGSTTPTFTATTTNAQGTANVRPHGLTFSPDASKLFAITCDDVYCTNTLFDAFALP